jgi:hypothetical protein
MMIESYEFGRIHIDGRSYTSDVIVFPERVQSSWWRKEGHRLAVEDLREVVEAKPEVLVVGTGYSGLVEVPKETTEFIRSKGIELKAAPTKRAVEIYNELSKNKRVVAALHLTC